MKTSTRDETHYLVFHYNLSKYFQEVWVMTF